MIWRGPIRTIFGSAFLVERLAAVPDLTMPALVAALAARGVVVHPVTVWRVVRSQGLRFKKTLSAIEQNRPAIARRRAQWKKYQGRLAAPPGVHRRDLGENQHDGTVSNFVRGAIGWNRKDHRYGDREGRFGPAVGWS